MAELLERGGRAVGVGLDDLAVLPATTGKEVRGHVEVVQVHERHDAGALERGEQLVVVLGALRVQLTVGVHQAAPLDGGAHGVQAQVPKDGKVLVATTGEVVAAVGAH